MGIEENKALVASFFQKVWNEGDFDYLNEIYDPGFKIHILWFNLAAGGPMESEGIEPAANVIRGWREGFPDIQVTVEDQIAEGDLVASRHLSTATHTNEFQGMAPTGKTATMTGTTLTRVKDGKIVEAWTSWDVLGMMQQLGVGGGSAPAEAAE
jgi:predicted SnoaL-like aldol condensation-catalyzing enzyme